MLVIFYSWGRLGFTTKKGRVFILFILFLMILKLYFLKQTFLRWGTGGGGGVNIEVTSLTKLYIESKMNTLNFKATQLRCLNILGKLCIEHDFKFINKIFREEGNIVLLSLFSLIQKLLVNLYLVNSPAVSTLFHNDFDLQKDYLIYNQMGYKSIVLFLNYSMFLLNLC